MRSLTFFAYAELNYPTPNQETFFLFQTAYDNSYHWFFSEKALHEFELLANRTPGSIYDLMIKRARSSWPDTMMLNRTAYKDIFSFLKKNPTYISIADSTTHNLLMHRHCELQVVGVNQVTKTTSFPYRKSWSGISLFSSVYTSLTKSRVITQLQDTYFKFNPCSASQASNTVIRPMDLFDVMGIFILLAIGLVFAILAGLIELMLRKCNLSCQRCTKGTLSFGKTYASKVDAITPDGVWVRLVGYGKRRYFVTCADLAPSQEQAIPPIDQGLKVGSKLHLRYNGNDPNTGERLFKNRG